MKKFTQLHLPILLIFIFQGALLRWAVLASAMPLQESVSLFSFIVAVLIFISGLLPALVRPQGSHTIVACFAVSFAFLILVPFELNDIPFVTPGVPLYQFFSPYLIARFINAGVLLPMAIHMSARFPRHNDMPTWMIAGGYILSTVLLAALLPATSPWQRLYALIFLFSWFTTAVIFFFLNLLRVTRDTSLENIQDAQRAHYPL